jgi:hypothetical protein
METNPKHFFSPNTLFTLKARQNPENLKNLASDFKRLSLKAG